MKKLAVILFLFSFLTTTIHAQSNESPGLQDKRVNLVFGLNQPLLSGFNVEGNLFWNRLAFDYSHGVSLNLDNEFLDEVNQAQGLDVHIPWTTGFGVGYRINEWLNVRAEPKWHRFEIYHMGDEQIAANQITAYNTFTMGLGAYANLRPFKNKDNFLRGFMIAPSIRWWPRVSSTLEGDQMEYYNRIAEQNLTHEALEVGINNTPLILNISIGYSIELGK